MIIKREVKEISEKRFKERVFATSSSSIRCKEYSKLYDKLHAGKKSYNDLIKESYRDIDFGIKQIADNCFEEGRIFVEDEYRLFDRYMGNTNKSMKELYISSTKEIIENLSVIMEDCMEQYSQYYDFSSESVQNNYQELLKKMKDMTDVIKKVNIDNFDNMCDYVSQVNKEVNSIPSPNRDKNYIILRLEDFKTNFKGKQLPLKAFTYIEALEEAISIQRLNDFGLNCK